MKQMFQFFLNFHANKKIRNPQLHKHINITILILLSTGNTTEKAKHFYPVLLCGTGFIIAQYFYNFGCCLHIYTLLFHKDTQFIQEKLQTAGLFFRRLQLRIVI